MDTRASDASVRVVGIRREVGAVRHLARRPRVDGLVDGLVWRRDLRLVRQIRIVGSVSVVRLIDVHVCVAGLLGSRRINRDGRVVVVRGSAQLAVRRADWAGRRSIVLVVSVDLRIDVRQIQLQWDVGDAVRTPQVV